MHRMTESSREMARRALKIRSTGEAIAYLQENPPFRTLRDILMAADRQGRTEAELRRALADGLCQNHPGQKRDAVERKIRNWFSGKTGTVSRDTALELCLILRLSVDEANLLLMRITDEGLHWRNPEEIIWGYAIANGLSYAKTQELVSSAQGMELIGAQTTGVRTFMVREQVLKRLHGTPEELLCFLGENRALWGTFHNEAYGLFLRYMQLLETAAPEQGAGGAQTPQEERMPVERILSAYFFSGQVSGSARSGIQRSVKANWPDGPTLSKMKNRADGVDVSRKVLILLFLATNGDETAYRSRIDEDEDEPRTREAVFRDVYTRLNLMLSRCGFRPLDARSPFDWIVLFCISVRDVCETDRRLNAILEELFSGEAEAQEGSKTQIR